MHAAVLGAELVVQLLLSGCCPACLRIYEPNEKESEMIATLRGTREINKYEQALKGIDMDTLL